MFTYFLPYHQFPGWIVVSKTFQNGFLIWSLKVFLQSLSLMFNLVLYTYVINYFLLPRFFLKRRYVSFGVGIALTSLLIFFLTWFEYISYNRQIAIALSGNANPLNVNYIINCTLSFMLFNLPAVAGTSITIKMLKTWYLKQEETEQVSQEKTKAELQLLKARIHPHFLFNSLNNIYSFAMEASPKAPEMIRKLSGLLHYMLYECNQPKVTLGKELTMILDYISLEKIRYGDRLNISVNIQQHNDHKMIAPLLLIPFIENSFKHGTSKMLAHPKVNLDIHVIEETLFFQLINNKPIGVEEISVNGNRGLGLKNVKKRLALLYPGRYELNITEEPATYTVWMKITLAESAPAVKKMTIKKQETVYELA